MASSLSNLANNISERIRRIKCEFGHNDKTCETCGIKYKYYNCFLEYINFEDDLIEQKCLCCNKNYQHNFDNKLKKRFLIEFLIHFNTFSDHKNNKFIFFLQKVAFPLNIWMIGKIQ